MLLSPNCLFRNLLLAFGIFFKKNYSSPSLSLHRESIGLAVIPGKSDIVEVAGFTTASDIFRVSLGFLSEITEEPFSVHPPHT